MTDITGLITVRPAVDDDAGGLARVLIDTGRAAYRGMIPDHLLDYPPLDEQYVRSERNWRRTLHAIAATPGSRERVFVAIESGRLVGFGMGVPRTIAEPPFAAFAGEVSVLSVAPTHQGRGVGRRLVRAVFQHLVDAGLPSVLIQCLTANAPARRFYEALGGRVVGERVFEDEGELLPMTVYGWGAAEVERLVRDG